LLYEKGINPENTSIRKASRYITIHNDKITKENEANEQ